MMRLLFALLTAVVAVAQARCSTTVWHIYIGGPSFAHNFVVAMPLKGPISAPKPPKTGKAICVRMDLKVVNSKFFNIIPGGAVTHIVDVKDKQSSCEHTKMRSHGKICCSEADFATAITDSIPYKAGTREIKPYNIATNNCQHFANRLVTTLTKRFPYAGRRLEATNGGEQSQAQAGELGAAAENGTNADVAADDDLLDFDVATNETVW